MGLGGACYGIIKFLVVVANLIFWVVGLAIVALSVWMLVDPTFYISMAQDANNYYISTYILLGVGILLVVVSFLGCCGAFRESRCMLITFFSLLLIVLVAQIAAGIWGYVNKDSLEPLVRSTVKSTVFDDYAKVDSRRTAFDTIQRGLECCGAEKPSDWIGVRNVMVSVYSEPTYFNIPKSCCRPHIDDKICEAAVTRKQAGGHIDSTIIYEEGCVDKLVDVLKNNCGLIMAVGIGVVLVEFIGLIFALILVFAISRYGYKS